VSYPPKVGAALKVLAATGLKPMSYAPPIHRLLWWIRIQLPPPHFASFWVNFSVIAIWFSSFCGIFLWVIAASDKNASTLNAFALSIMIGLAFAGWQAFIYHRESRKFALPKWSEIKPLP
jgi:hypothetical protein